MPIPSRNIKENKIIEKPDTTDWDKIALKVNIDKDILNPLKKVFNIKDELSIDFIEQLLKEDFKIIKKISEFITDNGDLKISDYSYYIGKKLKKIKGENSHKRPRIKVTDLLEIPLDDYGIRLSFCNFLKSKGIKEKQEFTALYNKIDDAWYEFETKGPKYIYILERQENYQ